MRATVKSCSNQEVADRLTGWTAEPVGSRFPFTICIDAPASYYALAPED